MTHATPPAPSTRERVLEAGVGLWLTTPPAELFGGLNVSRLSKAAGITRATFYTYWATTQEYLDDLVDHVAAPRPQGYEPSVVELMQEIALGDVQVFDSFSQACQAQMKATIADPALRVRLGMLAKLDDPVVAEKLRDLYRDSEQRGTASARLMLNRWGREGRPPVTIEQMAALYTVFMDAFAARHLLDPDAVPIELYSWAALALLITLTRAEDDSADLPIVGGLMERFPADGDRIRRDHDRTRIGEPGAVGAVGPGQDRVLAPHEITNVARDLLSERPWQEMTIEDLAVASGIRPAEIRRLFGSKHGLGVALVQLLVAEALEGLPPIADPLERLRAMLSESADAARRSPGLIQSAVLVFAGWSDGPTAGVVESSLVTRVIETVAAAQAAGQLDADLDPVDLGGTLLRVLLTQLTPAYSNGLSFELDAVELILRGAGATPMSDTRHTGQPLRPAG